MKTLSIRQIQTELWQLDSLLKMESEIIITLHGQAIARVLPISSKKPKPSHTNLLYALRGQSLLRQVSIGFEKIGRNDNGTCLS
ncbi:hypothetical protein QUF54_01585 [Candidatus Marithioploca araucensis]|uniref:Prevent-host-death family protein n=1 Tax=Candidatus Marithioploca araucensis TaxID=70273 RepID=A0ABT7VQT6_9GAMM|nr:hypothetical protein [Candidatus Marithioploca araucensis]